MSEEYSSFFEKLQEVLEEGGYEALESYVDTIHWEGLVSPERQVLGQLFVVHAEELLNQGDAKAFALLERAIRISQGDEKLLNRIGKIYASQTRNIGCLSAAIRVFETVLEIDPHNLEAIHGLVQIHLNRGIFLEDDRCFIEARTHCEAADGLLVFHDDQTRALFYWDWGKILFLIGKNGGEASEFHSAIEKYQYARSLNLVNAEFLKDFGDAYFELGKLLSRESLCLKAIDNYREALALSHDCPDAWDSLGRCHALLFENFNDQHNFTAANLGFNNALKIDSSRIETWLKWGQLLLEYGKHYESLEMIESSIKKFEMANSLEARNPMVLCFWAEALVIYGTQTDLIDAFKKAEELFAVSVAICPESDLSWHLYGCCYNELGRYFGSTYYYKQAIEKFQLGLGVNKNSPLLWHGIAFSYFAIGELTGDIALIEKSCQYCVKAMECGAFSQPQCWNDWGVALMKLGEMTQDKSYGLAALEKFENALNIQSSWGTTEESDPELLYNFGCALDFIGDFSDDPSYYEKAIQTLQKVLQLQPDHPHATYNLALALAHLGEFISDVECLERAIQYFEEIIQKDPEDEMAWNECGLSYMNLAQMVYDVAIPYKSQCHYDRAESMFRKAVSLGYAHAYYNLACHASLMGNCHLGMFYFEKAAAYGGLPPLKEIMQDDWLALLRQTPDFQAFISAYKSKDSAH